MCGRELKKGLSEGVVPSSFKRKDGAGHVVRCQAGPAKLYRHGTWTDRSEGFAGRKPRPVRFHSLRRAMPFS
jgi:hypothetical protein